MMKTKKESNKTFVLSLNKEEFELVPFELSPLPEKIYGDLDGMSTRVHKTFKDRNRNLGVLFSGLKGNSKTVSCIKICMDSDKPVVAVTEPFVGDKFKSFLHKLEDGTIVFIDEFEKVYNTIELQEEFLTILDGAFGGKKMFLFTSNSNKISKYLINRPNRIFYHFKYDNLDETILNEIIDKELKAKEFETDLRDLILILGTISYDVLLNIIDEVNRFKESPKKLVKELNIQVEQRNFNVTMLLNGKRFVSQIEYNPLTVDSFSISYKDKDGYYNYFSDYVKNYTSYTSKGTFVFESENNKLFFTPFKPYKFEL